ncbi:uncharacterized protein LOC130689715 [Daphnia carinata]|uniref:uncharacterized protein LOC130689715 n=1 Tax=Daphnia carinata TaxID=120202 RepID=UPI00257979D6|nr:uncharacterized protein LOC130689715 [Daphnia carinata]
MLTSPKWVMALLILQNTGVNSLFFPGLSKKHGEFTLELANAEYPSVPLELSEDAGSDTAKRVGKDGDFSNRNYSRIRKLISYDINCNFSSCDGCTLCERRQFLARESKMEDLVRCLDSRSVKRNRLPIHIAFIGDSTVRQHFISFTQWLPDYDRTIVRNSTKDAEFAFHEDRNLTSKLMDNLIVSFYWRPLIQEDLIADFKRWASSSKGISVPDFILLGVTAHHIDKRNILDFEKFENLLGNELMPLINRSLTVHSHQEIVWLSQSRTTQTFSSKNVYSPLIEKYNEKIHHIFKDTRVVLWDSINALIAEYLRACAIREFKRGDKLWYSNCGDFIHPGFSALFLSTSLIVDHICRST